MTEFSQSLMLGDNTFESLERQLESKSRPLAATAGSTRCTRQSAAAQRFQSPSSTEEMEVVEESPTNSKVSNDSRQKSVRERLQTIATQSKGRRAFRRHKPAVTLRAPDGTHEHNEVQLVEENFSDLFGSDLKLNGTAVQAADSFSRDGGNKKPRTEDELDDIFQSSAFSMDVVPRSQSLLGDQRISSDMAGMFEDTFDRDAIEQSGLCESLRVDIDDFPAMLENVTFAEQVPTVVVDESHPSLVLDPEMEDCLRTVRESQRDECSVLLTEVASVSDASVRLEQSRSAPTPASSMSFDITKDLRYVQNWGLPAPICQAYKSKGVTELFPWQVECLSNKKVLLESKNLIYSAPTSAGKTLVSEFLIAKTIVERKRKALMILPFVAVVREKAQYLHDLLAPAGIRVEGFFGGYSPPGGFESIDLAVCTIEKANSILNRQLEQGKLATIGLIVVDEVHLISDASRGYILELLLTKALYSGERSSDRIQVVGMSATLPNIELLARWLRADLYHTDFRPVELREMLKIGKSIYGANGTVLRQLDDNSFAALLQDNDNVAQLCIEPILESCSAIVFCPSKDWCEKLAINLAKAIHGLLRGGNGDDRLSVKLRSELDKQKIDEVLLQLRNTPAGLDPVLAQTVTYAVAYHHAGLTTEERDIIESSFKVGSLRLIVATSTLSSGVNLPARRVIIRSPKFAGRPMSALTYKQMIGRAGRKGRDTLGESILICGPGEENIGRELTGAQLQPVGSCLAGDHYAHLKRALLEVIASGAASTVKHLEEFVNATLLSCEKSFRFELDIDKLVTVRRIGGSGVTAEETEDVRDPMVACVQFLLEYEFIRLQKKEETGETLLAATRLGQACLASSMAPKDGFLLFSELQKARQCFVLESELHAIYLVTPYSVAYQLQDIDWMVFLDLWDKLPASSKRVAELVGVREAFMVKAMRGNVDYRGLQVHKRFYTALALLELVNEVPLGTVARRFKCTRGLLQSLQQMSSTFAGIVRSFCTSLRWTMLESVVAQFRERLFFGIHQELMQLLQIPSLNGQRARILYDAGITTLAELANADAVAIEQLLYNCTSFDTERARENENEHDADQRKELRNFHVTGRSGVTIKEAAKLLIHEARTFLQHENGVRIAHWSTDNNDGDEPVDTTNDAPAIDQGNRSATMSLLSSVADGTLERLHNSLLMDCSQILGNKQDDPCGQLTIVDVGQHCILFERLGQLLAQSSTLTMAFGIEISETAQSIIGGNLLVNQLPGRCPQHHFVIDSNLFISGVAFTVGADLHGPENVVYYLDLDVNSAVLAEEKQQLIQTVLSREDVTIGMYDTKEQLKAALNARLVLHHGDLVANFRDPRLANWLLQMEDKFIDLEAMVKQFCPRIRGILGLASNSKHRCAVEAFLVSHLMEVQEKELTNGKLHSAFVLREMPVQVALASMEVIGFPVNGAELFALIERMRSTMALISDNARKLNGNRKLNFTSSREVAAALNMAPERNGNRCRTVRQILERLDSPLAALVIAYRKIESNLARTIVPLHRAVRDGRRIHSSSYCFTSTGRITMHEPNLQTVVNDFEVKLDGTAKRFSCRSTFACQPAETTVLLSADFCQLELCVLAHLSQDQQLRAVLGAGARGGDIFRLIAAQWNQMDETSVTDTLRGHTKAIVYGVIYGMGARSMAGELHIDEDSARALMEQFHVTYPGIRRYTERIARLARELGYVETLTGRRRHLPAIGSADAKKRAEAERQAVCTTIQGSAADILKNAIVRMMRNLRKYRDVLQVDAIHLVLHLHDELLYEVPRSQVHKVAKILKSSMENCAKLSVPLRVKLRMGSSWGTMEEIVR